LIIVDPRHLKFLRAGRTIRIQVAREYRQGRDYAAGVRRNNTVCRVQIVEIEPTDAGWTMLIRQHQLEQPVYLARNAADPRAYTHNPAAAACDRNGPLEAVAPTELARYAARAFARDDQMRRERAEKARKHMRGGYSVPSWP
jgi:hypothetical protein